MTRYLAVVVLAALVGASPSGAPAPTERTVFVTVTDAKRTPILDLTAADFAVREDGKVREVTKAELATTPLRIAVIVDDNGTGIFRASAAGFMQRLLTKAQFAISSVTGQVMKLTDYTADGQGAGRGARQSRRPRRHQRRRPAALRHLRSRERPRTETRGQVGHSRDDRRRRRAQPDATEPRARSAAEKRRRAVCRLRRRVDPPLHGGREQAGRPARRESRQERSDRRRPQAVRRPTRRNRRRPRHRPGDSAPRRRARESVRRDLRPARRRQAQRQVERQHEAEGSGVEGADTDDATDK